MPKPHLFCYSILFLLISKANTTHTVILRPLSEGVYNLSFAVMTYKASDGEQEQVLEYIIVHLAALTSALSRLVLPVLLDISRSLLIKTLPGNTSHTL